MFAVVNPFETYCHHTMSHPAIQPMSTILQGTLHFFVAFDWGDEIVLEQVQRLVPASVHELPRRRTPPSFLYRPRPLYVPLENTPVELGELGSRSASRDFEHRED